jgi:L,D-peptidoglycan transpeptidase YkuD (ErfK/YbiS/YcfS/YnhG family)
MADSVHHRQVQQYDIKEQDRRPWRVAVDPDTSSTNMHRISLTRIDVWPGPGNRRRGFLVAGPLRIAVALGRNGIKVNKREGDGATPAGRFRPLRLWWRKDRGPRPPGLIPARPIERADGWCEDPGDRRYNRPIRLAPGAPGDRLTRSDSLYDIIIEIDHNTRPRIAGRGSAVFIHVARPGLGPTAGCIAMPVPALKRLVRRLGPHTRIVIHG